MNIFWELCPKTFLTLIQHKYNFLELVNDQNKVS